MKFIVEIEVENDAFVPDSDIEVSRILEEVNHNIKNGFKDGYVRDINGNRVGFYKYEI